MLAYLKSIGSIESTQSINDIGSVFDSLIVREKIWRCYFLFDMELSIQGDDISLVLLTGVDMDQDEKRVY